MGAGCVLIAAAGGAWLWGTPSSRESPALGSARPAATQAPPAAAPPAPPGAETTRRTGPGPQRGAAGVAPRAGAGGAAVRGAGVREQAVRLDLSLSARRVAGVAGAAVGPPR